MDEPTFARVMQAMGYSPHVPDDLNIQLAGIIATAIKLRRHLHVGDTAAAKRCAATLTMDLIELQIDAV